MLAYASATTSVVVALGISFQPVSTSVENSQLTVVRTSEPRGPQETSSAPEGEPSEEPSPSAGASEEPSPSAGASDEPSTSAGASDEPSRGPRGGQPSRGPAGDEPSERPSDEPTAKGEGRDDQPPKPQQVAPEVTIEKMSREQLLAQRAEELEAQLPDDAEFVLSSFNVLGSSHTAGKARLASGVSRVRQAANLIKQHGVDVVGFQELQPDQYRAFLGSAGGAFDVYPGLAAGALGVDNSIGWRTSEWTLQQSATVPIPYFDGNLRPMPYVLLKHNETGRMAWFANFHNPATNPKRGNNDGHRAAAAAREVALANQLFNESGYPVFVTGDMNDRESYFCRMTGGAPMIAANGGSNDGRCNPPPYPMPVDWIFGSEFVTFSNWVRDEGPLVRRTTDHPMIRATVTLDDLDGLPPATQ